MKALLQLSRAIDRLNDFIGRWLVWLVLASVLISAGNALVRKAFDRSSNAFLEVQWYLFSAVYLLGAGYTLLKNEHVRIDLLSGRFGPRGRAWIDLFGMLFMLLPFAALVTWLSWPFFAAGWSSGEMSGNAGGLVRWPAYVLIPAGFFLLLLQGVSEAIKRVAFLRGLIPDPTAKQEEKSAEQELAESILRHQHDAGAVPVATAAPHAPEGTR